MERAILEAESQVEVLETNANDPVTLGDHARSSEAFKALSAAQEHVKGLYERWAELESLQAVMSPEGPAASADGPQS